MKNLIILFFAIFSLASCTSNVDVAIDNPTENSIIIKIDSLVVEVPAQQVAWVEMGKGQHTITLENGTSEKFDFQDPAYFLNPTYSEYLLMDEFYGPEYLQNSAPSTIPKKTITFLGMEMEGNFDVVKKLINTIKWDYGPREQFPEMIEVEEGENYTMLTKLYDAPEVIKLYSEYENTEGEQQPVTAGEEDSDDARMPVPQY